MPAVGDTIIVSAVEIDPQGKPLAPAFSPAIVTAVTATKEATTLNVTIFKANGTMTSRQGIRLFGSAAELAEWRKEHPEDQDFAAFQGAIQEPTPEETKP